MNTLGLMYLNGEGVTRDVDEGRKWIGRAADRGYAAGQHNLGVMYEYGRGFTGADSAMAATYYQKGCEGGARDACTYLTSSVESMRKDCDKGDCTNYGYIHASGIGVPKSQARAADHLTTVTGTCAKWMTFIVTEPSNRPAMAEAPLLPMMILSQPISVACRAMVWATSPTRIVAV